MPISKRPAKRIAPKKSKIDLGKSFKGLVELMDNDPKNIKIMKELQEKIDESERKRSVDYCKAINRKKIRGK